MNGLQSIREENKLNQTEMAKILEISVQRYNSYERRRRKIPIKIAKLISETFQVSLEEVFLGMN